MMLAASSKAAASPFHLRRTSLIKFSFKRARALSRAQKLYLVPTGCIGVPMGCSLFLYICTVRSNWTLHRKWKYSTLTNKKNSVYQGICCSLISNLTKFFLNTLHPTTLVLIAWWGIQIKRSRAMMFCSSSSDMKSVRSRLLMISLEFGFLFLGNFWPPLVGLAGKCCEPKICVLQPHGGVFAVIFTYFQAILLLLQDQSPDFGISYHIGYRLGHPSIDIPFNFRV